MKYKLPQINTDEHGMFFELDNGARTKYFVFAGSLNSLTGSYPIYDDKNQVVEYMDIVGNFSKQPTKFSKIIYDYMFYELTDWFVFKSETMVFYQSAINQIPSKYFRDKSLVDLVKDEEKSRYKFLCSTGQLQGLLEKLRYKLYVSRCLSEKLKRSKLYKEEIKLEDEIKTL